MKKIISYFLSGIVLCTALLVTPVSAAEVAPAEETITINSTVSVRATNYWTKTTTKLNSVYGTASNISTVSSGSVSGSNPQILKIEVYSRVSSGSDSFYLYVEDGNGNVNYTTVSKTSYGKSSGKYDTTADFLTNIENRNGKFYTDKATIDKIGQVEARGEDFSPLNKRIMSSRASTEGGTSVVYKYSDELGTKYLIHEVTDARGYIIHRDFDAVRISSGQLINKGH